MSCKTKVRKIFLDRRHNLSSARREEAKSKALKTLSEKLKGFSHVLSFASMTEEIDLWPLNQELVKETRLLLPRLTTSTKILPFAVSSLDHLLLHPTLNLLEPDPTLCSEYSLEKVSAVLVPGIAFDIHCGRLGYGKGHYDRFLAKLSCPFFGVGFQEQLSNTPLETEAHDIPLTKLFLF
ncbi:MAG: 5-formyltetrahydrofolate cyclo-ligase [Simkaniaceae bacterium]|nr:MAG: 5-formyltetrahydrofolate cyclo-ligase [Simkaniaceae bacterium]